MSQVREIVTDLLNLKADWETDVKAILELKSNTEDSLNQLSEQLGDLAERAVNIENTVSELLDTFDTEDKGFGALASVLDKWENVAPQDLVLEWTMDEDESFTSLEKMPWPEQLGGDEDGG